MIQFKTTKHLFRNKYHYKVVLTVPGASMFRSGDMKATLMLLNEVDLKNTSTTSFYRARVNSKEDLDYAYSLQKLLSKMEGFELRVENPWISIYTDNKKNVDALIKLDENRVKYISRPEHAISAGTIILPKVDYEFKVTIGKTTHENHAFVEWAESNPKVKLTKSCIKEMLKDQSWGGSYFYLTGEKTLLVAKMHLGGSITKIERILKS